MKTSVLAVDIGASSGRIIKGDLKNNKIELTEIYRFENGVVRENDLDIWKIDEIFENIKKGIQLFEKKEIQSLGIDTWGVDFVFLDEYMKVLGSTVSYRDKRTQGIMEEFFKKISKEEMYRKTGIQFLEFNTVYQLFSILKEDKELISKAKHFMFIPDYLNYLLTGEVTNEYTNSTTSQMINLQTGEWDEEILNILDLEKLKGIKQVMPGEYIGTVKDCIKEELNKESFKVVSVPSHDTASAVAAIPGDEKESWAYINSGTWSLMGIEGKPITNEKALKYNFTNEGGIEKRTRVLKNIMGLWILQRVKKELEDRYSFSELVEEAKKEKEFSSIFNPNELRFFNPKSMIDEIKDECKKTNQEVPKNLGEIVQCIFKSLANSYKETLKEIEEISGKKIDKLYIVGGGANNEYLNQLCADYCEIEVEAGIPEATAIGNIMTQYIASGDIKNVKEGREIIKNSFQLKKYSPKKINI